MHCNCAALFRGGRYSPGGISFVDYLRIGGNGHDGFGQRPVDTICRSGTQQSFILCAGKFHAQGYALGGRSEEHTSELQSLMRISYAVFCLKKKHTKNKESKNI